MGQLRGPAWVNVSHGLYATSGPPRDLITRCRHMGLVLPPGAVISHYTAAALHGLPLPTLPPWIPLMATLPPDTERPERGGLYVARSRAGQPPADLLDGVSVLSVEQVIGQLAEDLGLIDLVVAIDAALHRGETTPSDIIAGVRARQRGLPRLRHALELSDARAESPWETILRLMHTTTGIRVTPQTIVIDTSGQILARADLRIDGTRRLPEYDGADHRGREQHEHDLGREKALARLKLERYGYIAREITRSPALIIRDAEDALGWAHDPARVATWLSHAHHSSLTTEGRQRLWRRLRRFVRPLRGRGSRRPPATSRELRESGEPKSS